MNRLRLHRDAVGAVARGHPWVYRDAVTGSAEIGAVVVLVDTRDRPVGWGLWDGGEIAVRVLGRQEPQPIDRVLAERIQRADALRLRVVGGATDCWRVVNGAGDGLAGLVIDRYADLAVVRVYSAAWEPHLAEIARRVMALGWASSALRRLGVQRVDGRDGTELLAGAPVPEVVHCTEHGIRLLVRPHTGQKTGLFLDQRENRRRVGELAAGRTVVNLFGYNGGFSIHAAMSGAARVHTVDLSAGALEDAREIFRLNGLRPEAHVFEAADVFRWTPQGRADLVICDPPSLTHGKKSDGAARSAYRDLAAKVGPMVSRDGLLAAASCTARLDGGRWERAVFDGLRKSGSWALLERAEAPADHPVAAAHPEGRYLKFAVLRRLV